jgi:tRNA threonylcarbamoyl adenosine modification protein (Sua5/YciO/YrdC/YwlC family)
MSMNPLSFPDQAPLDPEVRRRLLDLLEQGQIVALPTETCYGLAARADRPEALKALGELKGRHAEQTYTWHVGSPDPAMQIARWPAMTRRLIAAHWPGPLTLVLPIDSQGAKARGLDAITQSGNVGIRMPRHKATQDLLAHAGFPVVMTSANRTGEAPMVEASVVQAAFGEQLAAVADGAPSELGGSSSILALLPGRFELLRSGRIALEDLRKQAGLRILFMCTGNTCRSPMAEGLARHLIAQRLEVAEGDLHQFGFRVASAGVYAAQNSPVTHESVVALNELGLDISSHTSTPGSIAVDRGVDRIYGLASSHLASLQSVLPPEVFQRVELLDPNGRSIPDPIGGSLELYRETRDAIAKAIEARLQEWI